MIRRPDKPPVVVHIKSAPRKPNPLPTEHHAFTQPKERPHPLNVAKEYLGSRLDLRETGSHRLDGSPASLDTIMQATNRVLVAKGLEQLTASDKWRV